MKLEKPNKILIIGSGALQIGQAGEFFHWKSTLSKVFNRVNQLSSRELTLGSENEIHFWQLPKTTRFILEPAFCIELFDRASKGDFHSLAQNLKISYSFVCHLRYTFLKLNNASTAEVAKSLFLKKSNALKKLLKLESKGLIKRAGKIAPNRSILWQTVEVNS